MSLFLKYAPYTIAALTLGLFIFGVSVLFTNPEHQGRLSIAGALDAVSKKETLPEPLPLREYIEITLGCGFDYTDVCAVARSSPKITSPIIARLRKGLVLEVATTTVEADGHTWYKVLFTEWVRYPERVADDWYVAADVVRHFTDSGSEEPALEGQATTTQRIVIDRSDQTLYAYNGEVLFIKTPVSTGLDLTPTPRGYFTVYRKTPTRYMQGPLPGISDQYYDLPGVPWDLYFTAEGGAIHGAYWHNSFGTEWSHGCVNVPLDVARILYYWAPVGTQVLVQD